MRPGGAHIWPKGLDMNKLGRGPLDDATYQQEAQEGLYRSTGLKISRFEREILKIEGNESEQHSKGIPKTFSKLKLTYEEMEHI